MHLKIKKVQPTYLKNTPKMKNVTSTLDLLESPKKKPWRTDLVDPTKLDYGDVLEFEVKEVFNFNCNNFFVLPKLLKGVFIGDCWNDGTQCVASLDHHTPVNGILAGLNPKSWNDTALNVVKFWDVRNFLKWRLANVDDEGKDDDNDGDDEKTLFPSDEIRRRVLEEVTCFMTYCFDQR